MSRPLRIAFLDFGERWSASIKIGLAQNGHEVIAIKAFQLTSFDEVLTALDKIQPDFCLSRNFYLINQGKSNASTYRQFFENKKHRFVVWYHDSVEFNDPPYLMEIWQSPPYPQNTLFLSIEEHDRSFFNQRNLPFGQLAIAAGEHFFYLHEHPNFKNFQKELACNLSFVGTQIFNFETAPATRSEFVGAIAQTYLESIEFLVEAQDQATFATLIEEFFSLEVSTAQEFQSELSQLIEKTSATINPNVGRSLSLDKWRICSFFSWMKLTNTLNDLRPLDIHVYGSEFWKNLLTDHDRSTRSLGEEELAACYNASKINFGFTKYHFSTAIHERPFNILACRGFPLMDYKEDLKNYFNDNEIGTYSSKEELFDKIKFFLNHDSLRNQTIERGYKRVKENHTYRHRTAQLVEKANDFFRF